MSPARSSTSTAAPTSAADRQRPACPAVDCAQTRGSAADDMGVLKILAVAAVLLGVTGCAGGDGDGSQRVGYAADQPAVTIDFWYMPSGGPLQDQAVAGEAKEFHAAHPNI